MAYVPGPPYKFDKREIIWSKLFISIPVQYPIESGGLTSPATFGWPFGPAIAFWLALQVHKITLLSPKHQPRIYGRPEWYCWPVGPAKGYGPSISAAIKGVCNLPMVAKYIRYYWDRKKIDMKSIFIRLSRLYINLVWLWEVTENLYKKNPNNYFCLQNILIVVISY